jgi:hypothetical protein
VGHRAPASRPVPPGPAGGPGRPYLDTAAAVVGLDRVITERLDDLGPDERDTVELVAVAGPLPIELLEKLVGPQAPETLVAVGLLALHGFGEMVTARLAHPLHRDCLLGAINGIRRRSLLRRLVATTASDGREDPATMVRLALWHAELGQSFDPADRGWAARAVQGGLFDLVRRHLAGDRGGPGSQEALLSIGLQTAQERSDATWRLAAGSWRAERTFANGLALARAMLLRSDLAADMVQVLDDLQSLAAQDQQRAWLTVTQAVWLYATVGDREGSFSLLARIEEELSEPWGRVVANTRAGLGIQTGAIGESVEILLSSSPGPDTPPSVRIVHDSPLVAGLVLAGRASEALAVAERTIPLGQGQGDGPFGVGLGQGRPRALRRGSGRFPGVGRPAGRRRRRRGWSALRRLRSPLPAVPGQAVHRHHPARGGDRPPRAAEHVRLPKRLGPGLVGATDGGSGGGARGPSVACAAALL